MGNGGSPPPIQPAVPMPIKDDIASQTEAAALVAQKQAAASRVANDLGQGDQQRADAITRQTLGMTNNLAPQPQPRGPAGGPGPSGPMAAAAGKLGGNMGSSAVLTG